MALGLLILVIFALLMIAAVVMVVLGIVQMKRGGGAARGEGGACGKCGYSVNQLESMTCPECGADLREVGIKTRRGGKTSGVLLLVIIMGCVGGGLLWGVSPMPSQPVTVPMQPPPTTTPPTMPTPTPTPDPNPPTSPPAPAP